MSHDFELGEAELVAKIGETEYERVFFDVIERKKDRIRQEYEENPKVDNENPKNDWRWKGGMIDALKWVLQRPEEARKYLIYLEKLGGY